MLKHLNTFARRSWALLLFLTVLPLNVFAIPVSEAPTVPPKKVLDMGGIKPFKKATKVAVPGFRLAFVVGTKATARSENWLGGGFGATGAKASLEASLAGIDYATMQAITDQAYEQFLAKLKETGLEVIPRETIAANPNFQKIEASPASVDKPYEKEYGGQEVVVLAPTGLPLWWTHGDAGIGDKGVFSQGNSKAISKMSEELGAVMVVPTIVLDFAATQGSGNSKFARRAEVSVSAGLRVSPNGTLWWVANEKGFTFARQTDGVGTDGDFGQLVEDKGGSSRASFGFFKSKKKAFVVEANPEQYKRLALEVLAGAEEVYQRAITDVRK